MAKKRKKDKKQDEEYEFRPPDFNEREFLQKELRDSRAAIVAVGIAVLFGVIAGIVTALNTSLVLVAFIIGIAGLASLKYIYNLLGFDTSGFTKKNWAGTAVTYFFTFLAIWVLLINTPFADLTDPGIDDVTIWVSDGATLSGIEYTKTESDTWAWTAKTEGVNPDQLIHTWNSHTINITANIADGGGIAVAEIALNSSTSEYYPMVKKSSGWYEFQFTGDWLAGKSRLEIFIHAEDKHGNERLLAPGSVGLLN